MKKIKDSLKWNKEKKKNYKKSEKILLKKWSKYEKNERVWRIKNEMKKAKKNPEKNKNMIVYERY